MCDTLVVLQADRVLFAKNSDRDPNEAQQLDWQPRRSHPAGAVLQCTWIEVPQARETHAVLLSRPFWIWGAEIGANEQGVAIGNEAVFTTEPHADVGLTGMDLVRLGLERGATAEEAVQVMVELLETHGQGGGCGYENRNFTYHNSFIVADPCGAFVLETAGKHYAIEVVRGARSISNLLTIPKFAKSYGDRIKTRVACGRRRMRRTSELADRVTGVGDMFKILRDHNHDASPVVPQYRWYNGGMHAPCMHAGGMLAASQTTASWVSDLHANEQRHWATATAAPCISLFKPVFVNDPLKLPQATGQADSDSPWWRHERLHRAVMRDPMKWATLFTHLRDEREQAWLCDPPNSLDAFDEGDRLLRQWIALVPRHRTTDLRPAFVRHYWSKRDRAAGLSPLDVTRVE